MNRWIACIAAALLAASALAADETQAKDYAAANARTYQALIDLLAHPNRDVRVRAAWALGLIDAPAARPALEKLTAEEQPEVVRRAALEALGRAETPPKDTDALLADLDATDLRTRHRALVALAERGPHPRRVADRVLPLLNDPEPLISAAACRVLARVRVAGLKDRLLPLLEAEHFMVRRAAARTVAEHRISAAGPRLVAMLKDADYTVRAAAAWALGEMGLRAGIEPVADRLADRAPEVRRAAAQALVAYGPDAALNAATRRLLSKDSPVAARRLAAHVLVQWADPRAADAAAVALVDPDHVVRADALRALALAEDPRAVAHALDLLALERANAISSEECRAAWFTARTMKDPRFVPLIDKRLQLAPRWEKLMETSPQMPTTGVDMRGALLAAGDYRRDAFTEQLRRLANSASFGEIAAHALAIAEGTEYIPPDQRPRGPEKLDLFIHCME